MKNESLYQKTVDILLDAYNDGTLLAGNCYACAVGNIIAANTGKKIVGQGLFGVHWKGHYRYDDGGLAANIHNMWISARKTMGKSVPLSEISKEALEQINSTGYSVDEILRIEKAFENPNGRYCQHTLTRLSAVIKELGKIHETKEEDTQLNINKFQEISKKQLQTV